MGGEAGRGDKGGGTRTQPPPRPPLAAHRLSAIPTARSAANDNIPTFGRRVRRLIGIALATAGWITVFSLMVGA